MKRLINSANEYVQKSDWRDLALIKLCLASAGMMVGAALPKKAKKPVIFGAMAVFVATYVPLVTKFLRIFMAMPKPSNQAVEIRPEPWDDDEVSGADGAEWEE